jgi:hypothetical protein
MCPSPAPTPRKSFPPIMTMMALAVVPGGNTVAKVLFTVELLV